MRVFTLRYMFQSKSVETPDQTLYLVQILEHLWVLGFIVTSDLPSYESQVAVCLDRFTSELLDNS